MAGRVYGWKPDIGDKRDFPYRVPRALREALPPVVDLRGGIKAVYDQGDLGSCTANACSASLQYLRAARREQDMIPSRLFVYYNTRILEGTVGYDSGASIRNTVKSVAKYGYCDEQLWPYRVQDFRKKPTQKVYRAAQPNLIRRYERLDGRLDTLRACLADDRPFIFGFSVYESFETDEVAQTGFMPMPSPYHGDTLLGGHAVLAVGYDDSMARFWVLNSWNGWGLDGFFTMPYEFITDRDYADDFWVIRQVP